MNGKSTAISLLLLTIWWFHFSESILRSRTPTYRQCDTPTIRNGQVRLKQRGKLVRYQCDFTYTLHGDRYSSCQMGRWENPVPICIKAGCAAIPSVDQGQVALLNNDASALLFCNPGYIVAGSNLAFCDGRNWDRAIGRCREVGVNAETWCDFESSTICGWVSDPNNDFEWKRRAGYATTSHLRTGPKHDHTVKIPLEGHYLVAELTNILNNDAARILSPIYNSTLSRDACFRFYYHMFGLSVGSLRVYMKPLSLSMETVLDTPSYMLHQIQGSQGNQWLETVFSIEELSENFQIVIEAYATRGRLNDIAIDDVALLNGDDCLNEDSMVTTESDEEDGGIYDIQSCTNRCNETISTLTMDKVVTLRPDGKSAIIEKCDCHPECEDMKTCCLDYRNICVFASSFRPLLQTSTIAVERTKTTRRTSTPLIRSPTTYIAEVTTMTTATTRKTTSLPTKLTSRPTNQTIPFITIRPTKKLTTSRVVRIDLSKLPSKTEVNSRIPQTRTTQMKNISLGTTSKPFDKSNISGLQNTEFHSVSFIKVILVSILVSVLVVIGAMTMWKICISTIWMKVRRNPLDYKTKYHCKKKAISNDSNADIYDENEPITDTQLTQLRPNDERPEKIDQSQLSEFSDERHLTNDDEHLDFTLQEY